MEQVSDTGDRLSLTIKSKAKADVAVNYCKVDMSACEDHADTVRSMLSTIILKVRASQDDCEAQKAKNESLRKDLATATVR